MVDGQIVIKMEWEMFLQVIQKVSACRDVSGVDGNTDQNIVSQTSLTVYRLHDLASRQPWPFQLTPQ